MSSNRDSGWKADLSVRTERPFSLEGFRRRRLTAIGSLQAPAVTLEDAILSKLEWAKESQSERQFRDAVSVAVVKFAELDRAYLERWARELGVDAALERVLKEAETRQMGA